MFAYINTPHKIAALMRFCVRLWILSEVKQALSSDPNHSGMISDTWKNISEQERITKLSIWFSFLWSTYLDTNYSRHKNTAPPIFSEDEYYIYSATFEEWPSWTITAWRKLLNKIFCAFLVSSQDWLVHPTNVSHLLMY